MTPALGDEIQPFLRRPTVSAAAAALLGLDLAISHLILLSRNVLDGGMIVSGLLDFRYAWNKGVSFSLFWQSSAFGSVALAIFQSFAALLFLRWAVRTDKPLLSASLSGIAAGALGNVVSRMIHGAVFDYFALHLGPVPLFVFNISDVLICLGVVGILVETIWPSPGTAQARDAEKASG